MLMREEAERAPEGAAEIGATTPGARTSMLCGASVRGDRYSAAPSEISCVPSTSWIQAQQIQRRLF